MLQDLGDNSTSAFEFSQDEFKSETSGGFTTFSSVILSLALSTMVVVVVQIV